MKADEKIYGRGAFLGVAAEGGGAGLPSRPGYGGGIPRLKRDLGNAVVRDLLLTGRSINATKGQAVGLVSQVVGEGEALKVARITAAQVGKFDRRTAMEAKRFVKPIPYEELQREIDIFCELFMQPAVEAGFRTLAGRVQARL